MICSRVCNVVVLLFVGWMACPSLQASEILAGKTENKVDPILIKQGCTLGLISALLSNGLLMSQDKIIEFVEEKFKVILKSKDVGDTTKSWIAADYGLAGDDLRRLYPLDIRLTIAKKNALFDPKLGERRVIYFNIWRWDFVCQDSFDSVATQLRQRFTPNSYIDFPYTVAVTSSLQNLLTRITIGTEGDTDKISSLTIETWEKH